MIFFKNLYAAAILAGPIVSVLSALTAEQITLGVESLTNTINNAESTANSVTLATGDLETQVNAITRHPQSYGRVLKSTDTGEQQ